MERIVYEKEINGLPYRVTLQKVYLGKEIIAEFSENDIDEERVICSESAAVIDTNICRVLWKFEPLAINLLNKISCSERYEFFDSIKDDDVVNSSKNNCLYDDFKIVFYYINKSLLHND